MAIIYTYTKVTPQPIDSMVITDVSDKNFTKTALIGEAVNASLAAGTNICFTFDSSSSITTINSASYSFDGIYEPFYWRADFMKNLCGVVSKVDELEFLITQVDGTDVISTGEPLAYDISNPDQWNLIQFAYGGGGNVGYVPAGGSAGEYLDGGTGLWTTLPADQNTTYDLTAAADVTTPANINILLTGSDATVDTVTLVPGTNITMTDLGSNQIEIKAASGGYSWNAASGVTSYTVANGEDVIFTGAGGITVTPSDAGGGAAPYTFTIDGSGISPGTGTVTEVDATTDASVSPSGLTLTTDPAAGITATGDVDLAWNGNIGDLLYGADDGAGNTVLTKLSVGSDGDVLTSDGTVPSWAAPTASGCANAIGTFNVTSGANVTIDTCGETVIFGSSDSTVEIVGNNITKTLDLQIKNVPCASAANIGGIKVPATPYAGSVESPATGAAYPVEITSVTSPAGGCNAVVRLPSTSAPVVGTWQPHLISKGLNGTDPWAVHPDVGAYISQQGNYRVSGGLVYMDFFIEWAGPEGVQYLQQTIGIALFTPGQEGRPGTINGLQTLTGLANLPTTQFNNGAVSISDCMLSNRSDTIGSETWRRAISGGKLNKFYDASEGSAIWLHNSGIPSGSGFSYDGYSASPKWSVPSNAASGVFWYQYNIEDGNPYVAGSIVISLNS